ncbi:ArnT family glycosyltransferase [Streptomyces sp. NPDC002619]|uniref:ArnT family glycosyltransferase n=1 Tax=Streptomyces sp. NPDC002619 TaxID=3364655 RepID=UPI0036B3B880
MSSESLAKDIPVVPGQATDAGSAAVRRVSGQRVAAWFRSALTPPRLLLALIAALAAAAYAWSIDTQALEAYYAAGVRSMSGSWHAFFYDAFDPHADTTLDKLPGAFWVQSLFVRAFGYSVRSMVLPQVIESVLTVLVLYRAVHRTAGTAAALIAAAVLAASPVTVSSTRGDLAEPLYLLCTVLAADAVLRAVVEKRPRYGYVAACWVAAAFQAKMAEAWLVLPALALALVAGAAVRRRRAAAVRAGLMVVVAAALSLTWVCAFALTPASARPVVDGSVHNSVLEQVFDYNGGLRFGHNLGFGLEPLAPPNRQALAYAQLNAEPAHGAGLFPPAAFSRPGWDRLFAGELAPDCAWFLPAAVAGAAAVLLARRRAGPGDPLRAAVLMWSTWLLLHGWVFSASYRIHDYYLVTLVPPLAALTGTGLVTLWRAARRGRRAARWALPALIAAQGAWSAVVLRGESAGLRLAVVLSGAAAAAGAAALLRPRAGAAPAASGGGTGAGAGRRWTRVLAPLTAAVTLAAGFAGPLAACGWLLARAGGPFDTPFAAAGTEARPSASAQAARSQQHGVYGGSIFPEITPALWSRVMANGSTTQRAELRRGTELLVFQASAAASAIMGGVTEIQTVGGFTGNLPYPSASRVERLIRDGKVSLAVVPGPAAPGGTDPRVAAVESLCRRETLDPDADRLVYLCFR